MHSNMDMKRKTSLSFHKIQPVDLARLDVNSNYSNVQLLGKGRSSKVYTARHHKTDTDLVLKCIDKETTKKMDFFRELHYTYFLSPHPNIVNSFDVAFDTPKSFVFVQELATEGDLLKLVKNGSLNEEQVKNVVKQVGSALEFVHSKDLVHRDICLENVFVYEKEFKRVKIGDFGQTKQIDTLVKKGDVRLPWAPPEICQAIENEGYHITTSQDVWQLGILIFVCMTGFFPWAQADITDHRYSEWLAWHKRKSVKIPQNFKYFSPRLLRLFRRLLDPKPEMRYGVKEVTKYFGDPWVIKGSGEIEIYYDEDLSVNSGLNKPVKKVSRCSSTRSASGLYVGNYNLGLKRNSSTRSNIKSSSQTRKSSLIRSSSARSTHGRYA
ncbi:unnamed protein product [Meganyctiphanes norvegica]|uniref:Protein kinase domain-containing protein n=1 Tax=Meganyctiphanes norvegica TaxID=48144 RepID=A0AAV2RHM0_MEGNR